jgi:hypothetical protein
MYHSTENGEENYDGHGLTANSMIVEKTAGRGGRRREAAGSGSAGAMIIERGGQWEQHDGEAGSSGQQRAAWETPAAAGSGGKRWRRGNG